MRDSLTRPCNPYTPCAVNFQQHDGDRPALTKRGKGEQMEKKLEITRLAAKVAAAWLANPKARADISATPAVIDAAYRALGQLPSTAPSPSSPPAHVPAVSVRKSLSSAGHIISMIDGKPYRTLRRHLATHGLTPDEYRERYNLKPDYPMVAPAYSEVRRALAKKQGLGRKAAPPAPEEMPKRRKLSLPKVG